MIALASWAESDVKIDLTIDWSKLGLAADKVKITAPAIDQFQTEGNYPEGKSIPIQKGKGLILIVE